MNVDDRMKETLRRVEKSAAGNENILAATIEWLKHMDSKHCTPSNELGVATNLIDWAISTTLCRGELNGELEKLKTLKSETTASMKTLRSGKCIYW